ncbi:apolipoprotein N-acyltransferase [Endomicrobium proavitum]|nr:apolipoprotein N-acyltransferase [Endomicrobium proavitum]
MKYINKYKNILLSVLTGLLAVAAFPKIDLFFLAWIAFVPLISVALNSGVKKSFFYGFLSGFIFNAAGLYWLVPMLEFNTGSYVQAFVAAGALWIYLALYWAVWALLVNVAQKHSPKKYFQWIAVLAPPLIWVLLEYARTYFLTGFPWMLLGYSQYKFTEAIQIAEYAGVYGVSFIIVLCNFLFYFWVFKKEKKYLYAAIAVLAAVCIFGAFKVDKFKYYGDKIFRAVVIQPNIDQYKKWDESYKKEILSDLKKFSQEAASFHADLIVWPETVLPAFDKESLDAVEASQNSGGLNILSAVYLEPRGMLSSWLDAYNVVFVTDKNKAILEMHKKNHLVPFGEFIPFRKQLSKFFGVLNSFGDISRGTDAAVFTDGELAAGALICSENFFPDIAAKLVLNGARVLTNHTNDAWFFDTAAPHQHFIMNVFRAVETRKTVIVCANSGVSAIVEASGKVTKKTPVSKSLIFSEEFLQNGYKSFYTRRGDAFVFFCGLLFLAIIIFEGAHKCLKNKKRE